MRLVRTEAGTRSRQKLMQGMPKTDAEWSDLYTLIGLEEGISTSEEEFFEDVEDISGMVELSREDFRSAVRRLFEAGYIEGVEEKDTGWVGK